MKTFLLCSSDLLNQGYRYVSNHYLVDEKIKSIPLRRKAIDSVCRAFDADAIISPDYIYFDVKYYNKEYVTYRKVTLNTIWHFYDLKKKEVISQITVNDSIMFSTMGFNIYQFNNYYDNPMKYWRQLIEKNSYNFVRKISPTWITEERLLYNKIRKFDRASFLARNGQWLQAAQIWRKYISIKNKQHASGACYNLAVACEALDKWEEATEWINKALSIQQNELFDIQKQNIERRKKYNEKLKLQLNSYTK